MWSWRVARQAPRSAELAAVLTLSLFFAALAAGQAPPAAQQPPARKSPFEEVQEPKPEPPKPPAAPRNPFEDVQEPKPEAPKPARHRAPRRKPDATILGRGLSAHPRPPHPPGCAAQPPLHQAGRPLQRRAATARHDAAMEHRLFRRCACDVVAGPGGPGRAVPGRRAAHDPDHQVRGQ